MYYLLTCKDINPYEYYSPISRLRQEILPPIGALYCKKYLISDLLTWLDIVFKTRIKFTRNLGCYFSAPHLVMDLIQKISDKIIGLITDVDQHMLVERSMRGESVFHGDSVL